jgi:putative hemolysin
MKKEFLRLGLGLGLVVLLLTACQTISRNEPASSPEPTAPTTGANQPTIGLANPASENCVKNGGRLEIRTNKLGQYEVCLFEDNRQCEEWALLRGDCPVGGMKVTGYQTDGEVFCAITGGQVRNPGSASPKCMRKDGTLCDAQANLDGECPNPNDSNPPAQTTQPANPEANIKVSSPLPNETISSPFTVKGEARVFESQFNWRLKSGDGSVLAEGMGTAQALDVGQFGPFEIELKTLAKGPVTLEVFDRSAKDGSEIDLVSIPLKIK